jgi:excisionase family DNA binding protein
MVDESFVPIEDIAKHFAVSISTVRTWIRSGLIPALKLGGVYRFKVSEVEEALRKISGTDLQETASVDDAHAVDVFNPDEDL